MARCTRYNIMWYSLSVTCNRSVVFPGTPVSSTYKTDRYDIAKIVLKVALNTIKQQTNTITISLHLIIILQIVMFNIIRGQSYVQILVIVLNNVNYCLFFERSTCSTCHSPVKSSIFTRWSMTSVLKSACTSPAKTVIFSGAVVVVIIK